MPSIHVASTLLYALAARRSSRTLALIATGYCLIILLGSIHLGWHYAVDGEVSLLAVPLIWWLSGCLTAREVELRAVTERMTTASHAAVVG
jgi:TRAP-type C4-dicarboxylate transport system permease small subunit